MKKRWNLLPYDPTVAEHLQDVLNINPVFCQLLAQRGISSFEAARQFFRPSLEDLHDPFLMQDMDVAINRLATAIQQEEKILLYGDYDVDGTTSVALMFSFLKKYHQHLDYYIPDRYQEGYGISFEGIDYAKQNGMTLIIAMDCGIKAVEKVKYAKEKGIDFIICDHHLPDAELPPAIAVLDPKRKDCNYPYKELSGCGIAFKLAQAFVEQHSLETEQLGELLDLVVISIACDIVPMLGENRTLAFWGLEKLNQTKRAGLQSLIAVSERQVPLNVNDIVFGLGPRINAAGRLSDARQAVRLLLSKDKNTAEQNARVLQQRNQQRKEFDQQMVQEAKMILDANTALPLQKSIVLYQPHWHKGVVGIAAARVVENYHRPTIILTESNGLAVGSARSVKGFDIHQAIKKCSDVLINFGGHAHAAGLTLKVEQVDLFREKFEKIVQSTINEEHLVPEIMIAAPLELDSITPSFWNILRQFAPFGPANRNPVFATKNVADTGFSRLLKGNHLKLKIKKEGSPVFNGIGFGLGDFFPKIQNQKFHIAYTINENNWNGKTDLQLNVKDVFTL
ncbi:MAG TPA: single-stranded-DNA-specific exonuclease RecJ [Phaeodactylibacter sp.]|nr:single-stranded-DNA-specific exonuclease RecJ [Phaeodactylibacter sp.]